MAKATVKETEEVVVETAPVEPSVLPVVSEAVAPAEAKVEAAEAADYVLGGDVMKVPGVVKKGFEKTDGKVVVLEVITN